jgi:hypothetical protein
MKTILNRIYSDYLMPSRLDLYQDLLLRAKAAGYIQQSVREFFRTPGDDARKVLVHRHDIDSDVRTARKMFALEARHGVTASYYFRLSTLDIGFMREIEAYGSEASYHYEEVADFAKRSHIRSADEVRRHFPAIREQFRRNYESIQDRLAARLATVASHGDFANRRLRIINHEILRDRALRERCGIECESYDEALLSRFDLYISDKPYPRYYHPVSPFDALGKYRRICFLTHPNQWETNWRESTRCNVGRVYQELTW